MTFRLSIEIVGTVLLAYIVILVSNCNYCSAENATLKLVQVVFRHGDRNPLITFPTYPYNNESYWPEGFGQLTKRGKMQHYLLGQYLRNRYDGFLNADYSPYEVLVQSSNVDRTIMSAQANLAGLYPPTDKTSLWNPSLPWQPIPVHVEPATGDRFLLMDADCPRYDDLVNDFLANAPVMKKLREDFKHAFDLMTNKTGMPILTPDNVYYVYDSIYIQKVYYDAWPEWAEEGSKALEDIRYLAAFSFKSMSYTEEMQRLIGGPLVGELVGNLNDRQSGKLDERRKLFMYSAHDTTVATCLQTMGAFDVQNLPYAVMVMMELWQREESNQYFVKVFLRNDTTREPYLLTIPNCGQECSLEKFRELLQNKIPVDWQRECQSQSSFPKDTYASLGVGIGLLALATLLCFSLVVSSVYDAMVKKRGAATEQTTNPYSHLHVEDD